MKTIAIIFLSLFLAKNCKEKQQEIKQETNTQTLTANVETPIKDNPSQEVTTLEYEASTRGYFCKIVVENDQIKIYRDRNNQEKASVNKLSNSDLKEISEFIKTYNPEDLKNLKGDQKKRLSDGAAHANFKIIKKGGNYSTQGFDAGNAPQPIEKIVNIMASYVKE